MISNVIPWKLDRICVNTYILKANHHYPVWYADVNVMLIWNIWYIYFSQLDQKETKFASEKILGIKEFESKRTYVGGVINLVDGGRHLFYIGRKRWPHKNHVRPSEIAWPHWGNGWWFGCSLDRKTLELIFWFVSSILDT